MDIKIKNPDKKNKPKTAIFILILIVIGLLFFSLPFLFPNIFDNFNWKQAREVSGFGACKYDIKHIHNELMLYKEKNGNFPVNLNQLISKNKSMKGIPVCPISHRDYCYETNTDLTHFTVYCKGSFHKKAGAKPNYPRATDKSIDDVEDGL